MSATPARRLGLAVLSAVFGLLLSLLLVEGLVILLFDEPVQPRYVIDSGYGIRSNQPKVDTRHYVPGDYDVRITTNSAGMRGPREYSLAKPPGTRRVLVLGDSFAFGYGVEDDEVLSAVLEQQLNGGAAGAAPWEALNLAVSGFGQAEELVTWQARARDYQPDVVLLFYFENDIGNNAVSRLFKQTPDGGVVRDAAEFLPGSRLQERLFAIAPVRWLFEHSQAWNLIRNRLSSIVQKRLLRDQGLERYNDTSEKGMGLTRALLRQLADEVRQAGAWPLFVIIPDRTRIDETTFPFSPEQVTAMGAGLLDGRQLLVPEDYYQRDSHWRPIGHRKIANGLVPLIAARPAG
jgi:lysophospholipase L1-like esterase